ncbi:CHAP domain-containing protein [Spongiactinospora gelatinilytica]|uniref:CHAP domain-containing protein n=1 Tax=Spongiactinospora gelatinilytica TaxID=2666298 RepID=A0A2W2HP04_9ACTN|nr:CHAP domain-containing protein [Spongiactinospora gelatinilytica]PZG52190.1 CHAP domain-containing protein [Spongiactinospora gelatinilytica]
MFLHRIAHAGKTRLLGAALGTAVFAGALTGVQAAHADTPTDTKAATTQTQRAVKAQDVINLALSQVGVSENAAGGGTKFHEWYMSSRRALETVARDGGSVNAYANAPWCAMFVSWVGEELGVRPSVGWDAYTVTHAKWFNENQRWGTAPKPGAVVFFGWNGGKRFDDIDHVGFVVQDNGNGTIKTIEGNTGNGKVEVRTRPTSQVVGYGYPDYAA